MDPRVTVVVILLAGFGVLSTAEAQETLEHVNVSPFVTYGDSAIRGVQQHIELDHFLIVFTEYFVFSFSKNLTLLGSLSLPLSAFNEIIGVALNITGTNGYIGTIAFRFWDFGVAANGSLALGDFDAPKFESRNCWYCCTSSTNDTLPYPLTFMRDLSIDSNGYLWFSGFMDAYDKDVYRIWGYDPLRRFVPGLMYRVAPNRPCYAFVVNMKLTQSYGEMTYVFGTEYVLFLTFNSHWSTYEPYDDRIVPYEYDKLYTGLGYVHAADVYQPDRAKSYDAMQNYVVEAASSVFVIGMNLSLGTLDDAKFLIFDLGIGPNGVIVLSALLADRQGNYVYSADERGYVRRALRSSFEHDDWIWIDSEFNVNATGIDFLAFDDVDLVLYPIMGSSIVALSVQDCSDHLFCEECLTHGSLYCTWEESIHECVWSNGTRKEEKCHALIGVTPERLYCAGGENVTLNGTFLGNFEWGCVFYPPETSQEVWVNGTVNSAMDSLVCLSPALATDSGMVVQLNVWVIVHGEYHLYQNQSLGVIYYSCDVDLAKMCVTNQRPLCGLCVSDSACDRLFECSDAASFTMVVPDFPFVVAITPSVGPVDSISPVVVEVSAGGCNATFNISSYSSLYCHISYDGVNTIVKSLATVVSVDPPKVACDIPAGLTGVFDIYVGGEVTAFTGGSEKFSTYNCSMNTACDLCVPVPRCTWCPLDASCRSTPCAEVIEDIAFCPSISSVTPLAVPIQGGIFVDIDIALNMSLLDLQLTDFSCVWAATYGTTTSVGSSVTEKDLFCESPTVNASLSNVVLGLRVFYRGVPFTYHSVVLQTFSCAASDCPTCQGIEHCGWCVETAECTGPGMCDPPKTYLDHVCPQITALTPIEGSTTGSTLINVTGTDFYPAGDFKCRFNYDVNSTQVTNASFVAASGISCETLGSPPGFVTVDILEGSNKFTENSLSYVYLDCNQYNGSCGDCLQPPKADCGWCMSPPLCTGRVHCESLNGAWTAVCPTLTYEKKSDELRAGDWISLRVDQFPEGSNMTYGWECSWLNGRLIVPAFFDGKNTIRCQTAKYWNGNLFVQVMYDGRLLSDSSVSVTTIRRRKEQEVKWSSAVAILSILLLVWAILGLTVLGCCVTIGLPTPVVRHANCLFTSTVFHGAYLSLITAFLFIVKPTDGVCRARPWLACAASVCYAGPLVSHTIHKVHYASNNRKRYRAVHPVTIFFSTAVLACVDFILNLVWSTADLRFMQRQEDGEWDYVFRCTSTHQNVFLGIFYALKFGLLFFLLILECASHNLPSPFKESRYTMLTYLNTAFLSVICVPLIYWSHMNEGAISLLTVLYIVMISQGAMAFIFTPKLYVLLRRKKNKKPVPPPDRKLRRRHGSSSILTSESALAASSALSLLDGTEGDGIQMGTVDTLDEDTLMKTEGGSDEEFLVDSDEGSKGSGDGSDDDGVSHDGVSADEEEQSDPDDVYVAEVADEEEALLAAKEGSSAGEGPEAEAEAGPILELTVFTNPDEAEGVQLSQLM